MAMSSTMPDPESDITIETITSSVGRLMDDAWVDHGYTGTEYGGVPQLWLWDSCFHTLIWADLNRLIGVASSGASSNFGRAGRSPHGLPTRSAGAGRSLGRARSSSITQPPMYGAVAELRRQGIDVPDELAERAHASLRFLVRERARDPSRV